MNQKSIELPLELIIHPGEILKDILDDREMSETELAEKIGVTEKYVSDLINGKTSISEDYAKQLSKALNIEEVFWLNLQKLYDKELTDYKKRNNITHIE